MESSSFWAFSRPSRPMPPQLSRRTIGCQIGVVNYAKECPWGFQIGLVNIIMENVIPVLPIVNASF